MLQASTGRTTSVQTLKDVRDRLRDHLQAYFALPALPTERELWARIELELTDVDVLAGRIVEATAAGRQAAAQQLLVDELPDAIDDEADAIIAAITLNAQHVREVAQAIEDERRTRTLLGGRRWTASASRWPWCWPCWRCAPSRVRNSCGAGASRSWKGSRGASRTIC